ncbi:MAG: phage baseplate assembly protein V [Paludibacteraceae bacterium]|nr:phage baseplate assembly protein V [Paludibacteraceae bacterium]
MSQNLNPVQPKVLIDGENISFESLVLEQNMNSCHRFEVVCEYMSQNEMWQQTPQKLLNRIGSKALITFEHKDSGTPYEFSGWVTDVRIDAWESEPDYDFLNHRSNRVHIIGEGDIVKLNGSRGMDSFVDGQLNTIVTQSTQNAGVPVECDPAFTGVIPYVMRYQESVFEFLNRLSSTYNEMFFYDGKTIIFGQPKKSPEVALTFDHDVFSLCTRASALPSKVAAYEYIHETDKSVCVEGAKDAGSGLLSNVKGCADRLYDDLELVASASPVTSDSDLKTLLDKKGKTVGGSMLSIEGQTRTCQVVLGGIVEVIFPSKMGVPSLGRYRVVEVVHKVDKSGNYSNHFVGTPENREFITQRYLGSVKAYPEMAVVSSNSDPKGLGRVQVQFDWQKRTGKNTNWIRVQTPDAGGSGMANRGMVFIPEEGDQVMVGFEFGDPNRPYVMGSVFSGKNGKGGGESNNIHSIVTKSGRQIILDDSDDGGILITDSKGNTVNISTSGGIVEIVATNEISLHSKTIRITADEDILVSAGTDYKNNVEGSFSNIVKKDFQTEITGNYTESINGDAESKIQGKSTVSIEKDFSQTVSGKMDVSVKKDCKTEISGKLACEVSKDGKINSKSKMYVTGGGNVYIGK